MGAEEGIKFCCIGLCIVGCILAIALPIASYESIQVSEIGIDYDKTARKLDETQLYTNGKHFIGVSHNFIRYQTDVQTLDFNNVGCRSIDGLYVLITISFQYRLKTNVEDLVKLFYSFPDEDKGTDPVTAHQDAYLKICRNVFRDITSKYTAFDFIDQKTIIESALFTRTYEILNNYGAIVENFQLLDIEYPSLFQDAITATQNAKLEIETAYFDQITNQNEVDGLIEKALTEKEVVVNEARMEATDVENEALGKALEIEAMITEMSAPLVQLKDKLGLDAKTITAYIWGQNLINLANARSSSSKIPVKIATPDVITEMYSGASRR